MLAKLLFKIPALHTETFNRDCPGVHILVSWVTFNIEKDVIFVGVPVVFVTPEFFDEFLKVI